MNEKKYIYAIQNSVMSNPLTRSWVATPVLVKLEVIRETDKLLITHSHEAFQYRIHHRIDDPKLATTPLEAWSNHHKKLIQLVLGLRRDMDETCAVIEETKRQINLCLNPVGGSL